MDQKWPFFQRFFFRQYKNKKIEKSKNWHFSKLVNPRFWSENCDFSFFFFLLGNIGQENVFYDILKRKNAFLGYKNKKLQKSKNWHFSKGVYPGFVSKMAIFAIFFLGNIGQENVFFDILERKNFFLGYKNQNFKKSKNLHFSIGLTHGFGPKIAIFKFFFFRQYKPGNSLL